MVDVDDVQIAVDKIRSDKAIERSEGLENLKRILRNGGTQRLKPLQDDAYHTIFEAIFYAVRIDKPLYLRHTAQRTKDTIARRLTQCATVLRMTVETGASAIKPKTAVAIIDHITDALPVIGEGSSQPLRGDYLKCLQSILENPSIVEHLRRKQWQSLVDFLLAGINHEPGEDTLSTNAGSRRTESEESKSSFHLSFRHSQFSTSRSPHSESNSSTSDLVSSLNLVTSATNAPLMTRARPIIECMSAFLDHTTAFQYDALVAFNNVLSRTITEDLSLARNALFGLLPVMRRLWSSRSAIVKDQMMITLILGKEVIAGRDSTRDTEDDRSSLINLFDAVVHDYQRRNDRDVLHVDDLRFSKTNSPPPIGLNGIGPVVESGRALSNWTVVSVIATLATIIDDFQSVEEIVQRPNETPKKRRKIAKRIDDLLHQALADKGVERARCLQVLVFLLDESDEFQDIIADNFLQLSSYILDDDQESASWAMLLFAQFTKTPAAGRTELGPHWPQIWQRATQNLSGPGTARSACYLLETILAVALPDTASAPDTADSTLFSEGLNGFCSLTDSSFSLWKVILSSRLSENPVSGKKFAIRTVKWLASNWTLPLVLDRRHNAQTAFHAQPPFLLELLTTCIQKKVTVYSNAQSPITSKIYLACFGKHRNRQLIQYLARSPTTVSAAPNTDPVPTVLIAEQMDSNLAERAILEMLLTKVKSFGDAWVALSGERASNVSSDIVFVVATLCVVTKAFLALINHSHGTMSKEITELTDQLWKTMYTFVSLQETDLKQNLLGSMASALLGLRATDPLEQRVHRSVSTLVTPVLNLLQTVLDGQTTSTALQSDIMDVDDSFMSQASQNGTEAQIDPTIREDLPFSTDSHSALICMVVELLVHQMLRNQLDVSEVDPASNIVKFLVSLPPAHLLAARQPFIEFVSEPSSLLRPQAAQVLEKLAAACMQDDRYERCEASLCLCLDAMTALAKLWADDGDDDLTSVASDMYGWFLEVPLGKGLASTQVLKAIAAMLGVVLEINASFNSDTSLPSPRTSLFQILRFGDNSVKYDVAKQICLIFDRFVLTEHEAILDDVVDSLPSDPENPEGIALRIFVLTELAGRWNTLLRGSVYHVFETAAQVPSAVPYAKQCLLGLCLTLNLLSAQEIFVLFSPQILYTWLEKSTIDTIPFEIYGFENLTQLLSAVKNELVGQIAMRASTQQATGLSQKLGIDWRNMLRDGFAKAEAYTIARDISMPPREDSAKSTESVLRKQLGTETYIQLVQDSFPDVVATLFTTLGDEHGVERAFTKRQGFASAKVILSDILRLSHSNVVLPVGQQPTFRARFLLDELEFLCQRIDLGIDSVWSAPMVVHVCRTLFDSAAPALGSLHACAVLRKVRIVVSLAGSKASTGYPLEMLLHAIRPYLTNFQCSEDALGIFWYLLDKGKEYLQSRASFTSGIVVATFISLTKFLSSAQESTTQESHFKATMSKAQSFYDWLKNYLQTFQPLTLKGSDLDAFGRITYAASNISRAGGAIKGSHEGDLLLELLDDCTSNRHLLSKAALDLILQLACSDFEAPGRPREDILGEDAKAALHAPVIWDILLQLKVSATFRSWAAQTLGRAYAATGIVSDKLKREQDATQFQFANENCGPGGNSDAAILNRLYTILLTDDRLAVGQAERTLQELVTRLHSDGTTGVYDGNIDSILAKDLKWTTFPCPHSIATRSPLQESAKIPHWDTKSSAERWAAELALALCREMQHDPILWALRSLVFEQFRFAEQILPAIVHKVLLSDSNASHHIRQTLSVIFNEVLKDCTVSSAQHVKLVNTTILYLRCQPLPKESTMAERNSWLEIDFGEAARAATICKAHKTAILLLEVQASQRHLQAARSSRRSSATRFEDPSALIQSIFQDLDDPDFFYGIQEKTSIDSVLRKLDHEGAGLQKLSFQSALYDSSLKCFGGSSQETDTSGLLSALSAANMDGLARVVQMQQKLQDDLPTSDSILSTGLNVHQWDLPRLMSLPSSTRGVFMTFRQLATIRSMPMMLSSLDEGLLASVDQIAYRTGIRSRLHKGLSTLAVLTEVKETLASNSLDDINDQWQRMTARDHFDRSRSMILGREALFSAIGRNEYLQATLKITATDSQLFEVKAVRNSLKVASNHGASQSSLNKAMYLSKLASLPSHSRLGIESIAQYDLAKILWDQGEMAGSIQMLRQLRDREDLSQGAIVVSRSEILAELGHQTAEARLEKPEEIIAQCLVPAIKELKGNAHGSEAGRVFHDFAAFCDLQLQNPDDISDFSRIENIRHRKEKEVLDLERMIRKADSKTRDRLRQDYAKAKNWFKLDDEEYRRLKSARENWIQQSLENYLLSMRACDDYKNDALRFCALWLDQSASPHANEAVGKHITKVASRKFAPLMSQLASRLLDEDADFQLLLHELMLRICCDHPYHGMYQIFVGSKTTGAKSDEIASSRKAATKKVADKLMERHSTRDVWIAIHNSSIAFVHFAHERLEEKKHKAGAKVSLRELKTGTKLEQAIEQASTKIAPPTMKIPLRNDCDYSSIIRFSKFEPQFSIAGGVSAPKIVTIIGTDGKRYKMLLKGGNDDLRQDSIMEQVFEQVSNLLQDHRATRQRQLGIRTYKVLPLTQNAGIIEFVQNTIPLHEYSLPAHQRYFPKDYKPNRCRKEISEAQTKSLSQRVQAYQSVTKNFHPVLQFFFMEHFLNPDDWFARRLAYSRSTAAISILGHVLGLGDRHGHNILLDEQTGEVVHIDLGVAFEAGRVLPVPEVVPFRLTRDIVDGMGLSGVEGVFRRCCNFTLEALRQDQYSIMTILDVLRYDPLYSWSVSPLRLQRMQENQGAGGDEQGGGGGEPTATGTLGAGVSRRDALAANNGEPSEADRALTVVAKKLGKSLSVEATVNELIQQATDERNLATLYCGWAAYA